MKRSPFPGAFAAATLASLVLAGCGGGGGCRREGCCRPPAQGGGPRGTGGQAGWPGRCRASARRAGQQACHAGGTGQTRRAGPSGNGQLNAWCRNRELA